MLARVVLGIAVLGVGWFVAMAVLCLPSSWRSSSSHFRHLGFQVLRALKGRDVTAVPEVIGGHRLGGRGFKRALEVLRRMLDEA